LNFNTELKHVKESIPKYGEDIAEYRQDLQDDAD
jgi:hypothetical protein